MSDAYERLRAELRASTDQLIERYRAALVLTENPLGTLPAEDTRAAIGPILASVSGDTTAIDAASQVGRQRARQLRNPMHSLRAASTLYEVVSQAIEESAESLGAPQDVVVRLLGSLHNAIITQVTQAALPYSNVLLRQIHSAQRDERKRIARDLHDRAGYAIAIALQQIELRQIAIEDGQDGEAHLAVLGHSLREAASLIQEIAVELGQSGTSEGLLKALQDFIDAHGENRVILTTSGPEHLTAPEWIIEEAYLAIREGVRNALRHSQAPLVQLVIDATPGELRARVIDSGPGFAPDELARTSSGKGLVSMYERVQLLGGDFTVDSLPGEGTTLSFAIPLPTG